MRQNDFGGASSATRIAARITAGWVTATSRLRRAVSDSIQSPHPVDQVDDGLAAVRRPRRVGQPDRQVGGPHPAQHLAAPPSAVQVGQPGFDRRPAAPSSSAVWTGALLGTAEGTFGDAEVDRGVDLPVADRVERLVGGKSSGRHRVGHGVRHEGQPDDLTHDAARPTCFSLAEQTRRPSHANTSPIVA